MTKVDVVPGDVAPTTVVLVEPSVVVVDPGAVVVVEVDVDVDVVDDVVDDVVVDDDARQVGTVIVLASMVTAPLMARARPLIVAPVFNVIDVVAMIVPAKLVVVPRVAELPTCQNTLHA